MGKPVEFADVVTAIGEYGTLATLVTVDDEGGPHIGTVLVELGADTLSVEVGPSTASYVAARPAVSLCWIRDGADYQLIVDGRAVADPDPDPGAGAGTAGLHRLTITATGGIRHRLAGRPDAGPSCVALGGPAG
ncbi:MAG: pyridoxamine 5'-phosphate oxidase family protein [Desertimonas sp.]